VGEQGRVWEMVWEMDVDVGERVREARARPLQHSQLHSQPLNDRLSPNTTLEVEVGAEAEAEAQSPDGGPRKERKRREWGRDHL
jgi:hypothetical protein